MARLAERLRFVFVPLALCALVAVGAHAAADVASGVILGFVDTADAALDSLLSRAALTAPLVDLIGPAQRIGFARALALLWELCADAFLALPLLDYEEAGSAGGARRTRGAAAIKGEHRDEVARFRELCRRAWHRPTTLRIVRPLVTAAVALAGACSTARLLQGSVHLALHGGHLAGVVARGLAIFAVCALVASLAWRAVVHALFRADRISDRRARSFRSALLVGAPSAALLLPLAVAALRAAPLLSFLR
jgi:hypothetical protein